MSSTAKLVSEAKTIVGTVPAAAHVNVPMFDPKSRAGNQMSAAAVALGAKKDWVGGALLDMERIGREDPQFAHHPRAHRHSGQHDPTDQ